MQHIDIDPTATHHAAGRRLARRAAQAAGFALLLATVATRAEPADAGDAAAVPVPAQRLAAADLGAARPGRAAAGTRMTPRPANAPHPGVVAWLQGQAGARPFDTDHFLVQPPATARWTDGAGR